MHRKHLSSLKGDSTHQTTNDIGNIYKYIYIYINLGEKSYNWKASTHTSTQNLPQGLTELLVSLLTVDLRNCFFLRDESCILFVLHWVVISSKSFICWKDFNQRNPRAITHRNLTGLDRNWSFDCTLRNRFMLERITLRITGRAVSTLPYIKPTMMRKIMK